jgi:hypothetical protein
MTPNELRAKQWMDRWFAPVGSAMRLVTADLAKMLDEAQEVGRKGCQLPPSGWVCTRPPGHEGPCAAHPDPFIVADRSP